MLLLSIFAALFDIGSGAEIGLTLALCAQISPPRDTGIHTGTAFSISAFVALSVPPVSGRIVGDSDGLFKYAAVFVGFSCVVDTMVFPATHINLGGLKPVRF